MLECIPDIYNWPHRKLLRLELRSDFIMKPVIDQDTADKILHLIDEGINIRILDGGQDYLQRFKQRTST
jgi:hypothetical protein